MPTTPDHIADLCADAMIEHGPDGHCDGYEAIAEIVYGASVAAEREAIVNWLEGFEPILENPHVIADAIRECQHLLEAQKTRHEASRQEASDDSAPSK